MTPVAAENLSSLQSHRADSKSMHANYLILTSIPLTLKIYIYLLDYCQEGENKSKIQKEEEGKKKKEKTKK